MPYVEIDNGPLPRSPTEPDIDPYDEVQMSQLVAAEAARITQLWTRHYPDNSDLQASVRGAVGDVLGLLDGAATYFPGFELVPVAVGETRDHYGTVWPAIPFGGDLQARYYRTDRASPDQCELFVRHCNAVEKRILEGGIQQQAPANYRPRKRRTTDAT